MSPNKLCLTSFCTSDQRNEELPTLLHFAAKYGLTKLTTVLQQCPGALQAYSVMNKHGDYPNKLAEKSGFSDLRRLMDKFVVSVAKNACSKIIKAFDFLCCAVDAHRRYTFIVFVVHRTRRPRSSPRLKTQSTQTRRQMCTRWCRETLKISWSQRTYMSQCLGLTLNASRTYVRSFALWIRSKSPDLS